MNIRIFITGGSGYIGSVLIPTLTDNISCVIKNYDLKEYYDLTDFSQLLSEMAMFKPDLVIHLAAISTVNGCSTLEKTMAVNLTGTKNVLKAMSIIECKHIIYASSCAVYGNLGIPGNFPVYENDPIHPISPYGCSKLAGEHIIFNHYHIRNNLGNYIIFRMFNVVGTSKYQSSLNFGEDRIFSKLFNGEIIIYGKDYPTEDGTCVRDYVSITDICQAYLNAVKVIMTLKIRECINLSSCKPISVLGLIKTWNNMMKSYNYEKVKIIIGNRRLNDPVYIVGFNNKAQIYLNWRPQQSMKEIMINMIN